MGMPLPRSDADHIERDPIRSGEARVRSVGQEAGRRGDRGAAGNVRCRQRAGGDDEHSATLVTSRPEIGGGPSRAITLERCVGYPYGEGRLVRECSCGGN